MVFLQLRPELERFIVRIDVKALAEDAPLVIHLRHFVIDLTLLRSLELSQLLLGFGLRFLQLFHLRFEDGLREEVAELFVLLLFIRPRGGLAQNGTILVDNSSILLTLLVK